VDPDPHNTEAAVENIMEETEEALKEIKTQAKTHKIEGITTKIKITLKTDPKTNKHLHRTKEAIMETTMVEEELNHLDKQDKLENGVLIVERLRIIRHNVGETKRKQSMMSMMTKTSNHKMTRMTQPVVTPFYHSSKQKTKC
jgi:hypothetical protein